MRLALCGVPLIVVTLWSGSAWTQDEATAAALDNVTKLNRDAVADVEVREWEGAKKKLLDALVLAKRAGLDNHPIMARTYVNLGVVYVMGFKNRDKGVQSFRRALEIQPDIGVTRIIAVTPEVPEVFEEAGGRPGRVQFAVPGDGFGEPDLPAHVSGLECPVVAQTRVDQAVPVRCAVSPNLPVTKVFLLYREPVKQRFTAVEMKRTPKGWFQGRIPERVIYGESVQFYFEARNARGKPIVRNGDEQSPNLVVIVGR
jgi:hypothetical protein